MKHLLQAHGIRVVNNQIAKADVEKAINIIATAGKYDSMSEKVQLALINKIKDNVDNETIKISKKIKNPIISGKFDITSIWDMFPPEFRKKFKNLIISGDNLIIQYKELFDGEEEKYAQFLEFSYSNGKVKVGISTVGEDSGTDGLGETFGTYDLKDKDFVKKIMKEVEENFGN